MRDAPFYESPLVLFRRPLEFFPTRGMAPAEHLNAMVRFVLYASAILAAYRRSWTPVLGGVIVVTVLGCAYTVPRPRENQTPLECTPPTPDNPFMNVLVNEYNKPKPRACAASDLSKTYFERGLPREISDVYRNRASDRQFVTQPVTENIPDTRAFRNFLYSDVASSKK